MKYSDCLWICALSLSIVGAFLTTSRVIPEEEQPTWWERNRRNIGYAMLILGGISSIINMFVIQKEEKGGADVLETAEEVVQRMCGISSSTRFGASKRRGPQLAYCGAHHESHEGSHRGIRGRSHVSHGMHERHGSHSGMHERHGSHSGIHGRHSGMRSGIHGPHGSHEGHGGSAHLGSKLY